VDSLHEQLRDALRGLDYPATLSKVLTVALQNGAAPAVIERLRNSHRGDFLNADMLEQEFGVRVPGSEPHGWE
jgi:hypothetical protein